MTTTFDQLTAPEGHERRRLHHEAGCDRPEPHIWHGKEELMQRCQSCKKITPLWRKIPAPKSPPAPTQRVAPARYVCRDHYAPVNWRGKGCRACQAGDQ